jgi:undecaprenyl pyrophosphate synthase
LWPDFDDAELELAFRHYAGRQRRFGLAPHQVGGD